MSDDKVLVETIAGPAWVNRADLTALGALLRSLAASRVPKTDGDRAAQGGSDRG